MKFFFTIQKILLCNLNPLKNNTYNSILQIKNIDKQHLSPEVHRLISIILYYVANLAHESFLSVIILDIGVKTK